jgi:hypothetical protein
MNGHPLRETARTEPGLQAVWHFRKQKAGIGGQKPEFLAQTALLLSIARKPERSQGFFPTFVTKHGNIPNPAYRPHGILRLLCSCEIRGLIAAVF